MFERRIINDSITIGLLDLAAFSKQMGISLKREIERQGTQYLLKELLKSKTPKLAYTLKGKPFLENEPDRHLSISHSHDKLAIILNNKENTGIDIEMIRDKVINIQHKFLSDVEMSFAAGNVDKLLTIWAAKESMYKLFGEKELEFRENLFVEDFADENITGRIVTGDFRKTFRLIAGNVDNYKMVYVLNEL